MRVLLFSLFFVFNLGACTTFSENFGFITKPYEESVDETLLAELLHKAKESFAKKETGKTWDYVNEAEEISPQDPRVTEMKGSLLYSVEDYQGAKEYWEKSLRKDPNQPKIKQFLQHIKEKSLAP